MKYYYTPQHWMEPMYGEDYICNHPLFEKATLIRGRNKGLLIVQQRFNVETKQIHWGAIDPWLANDIYMHPKFYDYFTEHAGVCTEDNLYPTVSVRSLMWSLRMKPLKREFWEDWKGDIHV